MKTVLRKMLVFALVLNVVMMFSNMSYAFDFSGQPPKTVALEGVDCYTTYGGTAKVGMTWSTNDPAKLVGGFFNHIKKDGVDIPVGDPFYIAKPEGSGNDWFHGPRGYLATTVTEFQSETAKWPVYNVTEPHTFEFSAASASMFTNNDYEYEENLVGSPAIAHVYLSVPVEMSQVDSNGTTSVTGIFDEGTCETAATWNFTNSISREGKYVGTAPKDAITVTTAPKAGYKAKVEVTGGTAKDNKDGTWEIKGNVPISSSDKLNIKVSYEGNVTITWDPDGGSIAGVSGNKIDTGLSPGEAIIAPKAEVMEKAGAVFEKWVDILQQDIPGAVPHTSVTYKALWSIDENGDGIADSKQLKFKFDKEGNGKLKAPVVSDKSVKDNGDGTYTVYITKDSGGQGTLTEAQIPELEADPGFAFDKWNNLKPGDSKSPAGKYSSNENFTAKFSSDAFGGGADKNQPDGIADKYQMMFTFKVGSNGKFENGIPNPVVKTKLGSDGTTMDENGKTSLEAGDIPSVKGISNSYILNNWTVSDGIGNKTSEELTQLEYTGGNKEITANFVNAKAELNVVENHRVAKGMWKNETEFSFTVQLRIGEEAATQQQMEAVKINGGELYRERPNHFPGNVSDYLGLDEPEFSGYKKVDIEGKQYGQMTMKLKKSENGRFKSSIVKFIASYDDGIAENFENRDELVTIIPGDISRNGNLFAEDIVALKREISGNSTAIAGMKYFKEIADMNGNGNTFTEDIVIMSRMISGGLAGN